MGQPAYDMSSEVRRIKAPQTQRKVALRVEKGGKRRLNPVQAAMQHLLQLISMALLAGLAVSLLWSEAQLVDVFHGSTSVFLSITDLEALVNKKLLVFTYNTSILKNRQQKEPSAQKT